MAASAGSATVDTDGAVVYSDTEGCASFFVGVKATSENGALVKVPGLHEAADFLPMVAGQGMVFRLGYKGIKSVTVKGDGGDALITYGVVAKYPSTLSTREP